MGFQDVSAQPAVQGQSNAGDAASSDGAPENARTILAPLSPSYDDERLPLAEHHEQVVASTSVAGEQPEPVSATGLVQTDFNFGRRNQQHGHR